MASRQACKQCRRRKVKCDGLPTCRNCFTAKTTCHYSTTKKRGPKSVKWQNTHAEEIRDSTPAATVSSEGVESPALPIPTDVYPYLASESPNFNKAMADFLVDSPESQTRTAIRIHRGLLAGLLAAVPSETAISIVNHCILLYTQYVFETIPICHEPTVRATVGRCFISLSDGDTPTDDYARVSGCFVDDKERGRVQALRTITLLTALCAAVSCVVPESLLPKKTPHYSFIPPSGTRNASDLPRL